MGWTLISTLTSFALELKLEGDFEAIYDYTAD